MSYRLSDGSKLCRRRKATGHKTVASTDSYCQCSRSRHLVQVRKPPDAASQPKGGNEPIRLIPFHAFFASLVSLLTAFSRATNENTMNEIPSIPVRLQPRAESNGAPDPDHMPRPLFSSPASLQKTGPVASPASSGTAVRRLTEKPVVSKFAP